MPNRNDPYSRPINATRPEGQMLQGEFYGEKAHDKVLHQATGGRAVHQLRPMVSVVPAWPEDPPVPEPKTRKKKVTTPSPDATSPSEPVSAEAQPPSVTEDDLFG